MRKLKNRRVRLLAVSCCLFFLPSFLAAQSVASGTIDGVVTDSTSAVIAGARVEIKNLLTSFDQTTTTDAAGAFHFTNLPYNNYHLQVTQQGFTASEQDVSVRTAVPANVKVVLALSNVSTSVNVEASGADLLEPIPFAHSDVNISSLAQLPLTTPSAGLSDAITLESPGVVADSNGFFHPLGDHAQTSFSIDGQPISDQQSKAFSTQMPVDAIQSMELVTGTPNAEYGDKTSLVVNTTTKSGLGQTHPSGSLETQYGSFGTISQSVTLGFGTPKFGYFIAANGNRSGRFLDSPEFQPFHDIGNGSDIFNRLDYNPTGQDALHLNLFVARNWFQIPNTYDQLSQDQRQRVMTFNIAPGYQHTFSTTTLLTVSPFIRQDRVNFYPSGDIFNDTPATIAQERTLTNYGLKTDLSYAKGVHNFKTGIQVMQTRLHENFDLGITSGTYNSACVDSGGNGTTSPITDPGACAAAGLQPNPNYIPGLLALDLTRGGSLFQFAGAGNVNEYAFYIQDTITWHKWTLNPGLRIDRYQGLTRDSAGEPRLGLSYQIHNTILRGGYARTMETPYNENLLLSSEAGQKGLTNVFGAQGAQPLYPGRRNQFNAGFQQAFGKYLQVDGDYFWKYTRNAFDFDVILNTPITFPISWNKSKLDGFSLRFTTPNIHGLQAYTTMGHTRARFFGPEVGGLLFNSPVDVSVFRIDHDEALEETTNVRYQWHKNGPWASFTWRFDSGEVAGAVGTLGDVLALSADEQAAIGFYCGNNIATLTNRITSCSANYGAARVRIPAAGTENDDTNPPRIAPRNLLDVAVGTDDLLRKNEDKRVTLTFSITNLTNTESLYNFLSTFSGTHFVAPRTYQASVGYVF